MITSPEKERKERKEGTGLGRVRNTLLHPSTFHRLPIKAVPAVEDKQREKAAARGGSICVFALCATSRAATITPPPGGTGCVWEREVRDLLRLTHTTLTSPTERASERADGRTRTRGSADQQRARKSLSPFFGLSSATMTTERSGAAPCCC